MKKKYIIITVFLLLYTRYIVAGGVSESDSDAHARTLSRTYARTDKQTVPQSKTQTDRNYCSHTLVLRKIHCSC